VHIAGNPVTDCRHCGDRVDRERVIVVHIVHGAGSAERMAACFEHGLFARKAALHKRVARRRGMRRSRTGALC